MSESHRCCFLDGLDLELNESSEFGELSGVTCDLFSDFDFLSGILEVSDGE